VASLGEFQRAFASGLLDGAELTPSQLAQRVHRNTTTKGLVDALAANYPTIVQLVGQEWFEACALDFVRAHPACSPVLVRYGERFPDFLEAFGPAASLPYLSEAARIDRQWIEAYTSQGAEPLSQVEREAVFEKRLTLHPAARLGWFKHSAASVWVHHRTQSAPAELYIADNEEGLLLTRPSGTIEHFLLDRAGFVFLERIHAGETLGAAATAALEVDLQTDIAGRLAQFIQAGAFAR
jgi:hypothetical protein